MTADPVQFLRARLNDDVRVALDASGFTVVEDSGQWVASPAGDEWEAARTECDEDELLVALRPGLARPPEVMSDPWGAIVSDAPHLSQQPGSASVLPQLLHAARHDPARVLAEVDAKRQIMSLHEPLWETVEWPHDQNGKGEAQVCKSCGNRDIDSWQNWRPAVGEAGDLPPGVVPPYIMAPCQTLRLLALPYAWHADYREEWKP